MPLIGNTIFAGDSITVGLPPYVGVTGTKKLVAEGGRPTDWLLRTLRTVDASGGLAGFQNLVVLIGTNDIGGGRTVDVLTTDIRSIWQLAKARGLRVFAMTIPPAKGYSGFASNFDVVNARRKAINANLGAAFVRGEADGLIDISALMADPSDPDRLARDFDGGDHLHPRKDAMGALLTRALSATGAPTTPAVPLAPAGFFTPPTDSSGTTVLFLLAGVGGLITYLLTRKHRR